MQGLLPASMVCSWMKDTHITFILNMPYEEQQPTLHTAIIYLPLIFLSYHLLTSLDPFVMPSGLRFLGMEPRELSLFPYHMTNFVSVLSPHSPKAWPLSSFFFLQVPSPGNPKIEFLSVLLSYWLLVSLFTNQRGGGYFLEAMFRPLVQTVFWGT